MTAAKLALITSLAVGCGRSPQPAAPGCEALHWARPMLLDAAYEDLEATGWDRAQPADRRPAAEAAAVDAAVNAVLAACVEEHWSPQAIECILIESRVDPAPAGTCKAADRKQVFESYDRAQAAVFTKAFGPKPPPRPDLLEEYARQRELPATDDDAPK